MIAYKGFNQDLTCTSGKGTYQYTPGVTVTEKDSKARRTGFHYSEYPPECFHWYPINGKSRYFLVEAAGSIDEECSDVSSCTEITLMEELSVQQMALHTISYMLNHPLRPWETVGTNLEIAAEIAECMHAPGIAIARGKHPKVCGCAGTTIGLLAETEDGWIASAYMVGKGEIHPGKWYGIVNGEVRCLET